MKKTSRLGHYWNGYRLADGVKDMTAKLATKMMRAEDGLAVYFASI